MVFLLSKVNETVAWNIRNIRKSLKLRQSDIADMIGYSVKTISKWENGGGLPPSEILPELSKALRVDINRLFRGDEQPMYYLGIDGGGTKTDFVLVDKDGQMINHITLNGTNPVDVGEEDAFRVLRDGIYRVCRQIPFSQISVYAGIAGGGASEYPQKISRLLEEFHFSKTQNGNDVKECIELGLGERDGIVVILGTGSIAYTQYKGTIIKTGGFGYLLGDEGSGYAIGRDMLRAVLEAEEGNGEDTSLLESMLKECGTKTVVENISKFYKGGKKLIASYAPMVFEAWKKGDPVGRCILEENMHSVARMIINAGKKFPPVSQAPVVLFGSITKDEDIVLSLIQKHLGSENVSGPVYQLSVCTEPIYKGALMLAGLKTAGENEYA